jgi:hypothetical protein
MSDDDSDPNFSPEEGDAALETPVDPSQIPSEPNFSETPPEPLVQPMVRLLSQWIAPWGPTYLLEKIV